MKPIALIAEGQTDLYTIELMLQGIFSKDISINYRFPDEDEQGGWGHVFKKIASDEFEQLFYSNSRVIIHLDSDVFLEQNIPSELQGKIRSDDEVDAVVRKMREIIIDCIGKEVYQEFADRIFFAIAVHQIECWLLPYLYDQQSRSKIIKTTGCLEAVNRSSLCKDREITIDKSKKQLKYYQLILGKEFRKNAELCRRNPSAEIFIKSLEENERFIE